MSAEESSLREKIKERIIELIKIPDIWIKSIDDEYNAEVYRYVWQPYLQIMQSNNKVSISYAEIQFPDIPVTLIQDLIEKISNKDRINRLKNILEDLTNKNDS